MPVHDLVDVDVHRTLMVLDPVEVAEEVVPEDLILADPTDLVDRRLQTIPCYCVMVSKDVLYL